MSQRDDRASNLIVSAWDDQLLVGIARSVPVFSLLLLSSDLAVDVAYQRRGIGRRLIQVTQDALGPNCSIIVLAAPAIVDYYRHLGFEHHDQASILVRTERINEKRATGEAGTVHN